jgi:hypothetical protein
MKMAFPASGIPFAYPPSMPKTSIHRSIYMTLRKLPAGVMRWLRTAPPVNTRAIHYRAPHAAHSQEPLILTHPVVIVVNHGDPTADPRRAAARPANLKLVLVDDGLESDAIAGAVKRATDLPAHPLPAALLVRQDHSGELHISGQRITIPQATRIVHLACGDADHPQAHPAPVNTSEIPVEVQS